MILLIELEGPVADPVILQSGFNIWEQNEEVLIEENKITTK